MLKFKTLEELEKAKEELREQYGSGEEIPNYMRDFFDSEEERLRKNEFFEKIREKKYSTPIDERHKYKKEQEEKFWESNTSEIVKLQKPVRNDFEVNYEEPNRGDIDEERDLTPEEIRVLIGLCENDLYLFAVRYFPHYLKKSSSELHKFLYRTLAREVNDSKSSGIKWAIAAPRGNAKSSIVSGIFPLWCLCYKKKNFIVLLSDTAGQAQDFLADIKRELEFNLKLIRDFPNVCGKGLIWRIDEIITANQVKMIALGTGNKIRGRRFGIYRPDLVIGDDLENYEMVYSDTQRNKIRYEWFNKDVIFAGGEEGSRTDFFIVGTTIGRDSLLNALLDPNEYPEWDSRRFAAVKKFSMSSKWDDWEKIYKNRFDSMRKENAKSFFEEHQDEMLAETEVLWPEGDPYYSLMEYKITNPSGFVTEKQNAGYDSTKVYINRDQLHWENFSTNPRIKDALKRSLNYGALDPSLGKKSTQGDYSVILTISRDPKTGFLLVLDIDVKRRSVDDQIDEILKKHEKYRYKLFGIETNAFQYVVADSLRKRSRKEGSYVPIKEINQYSDKKLRIEGVIPFLLDGTIIFDTVKYKTNQQYNLGVEQICTYTGEGSTFDDTPDCLEMAFQIAKAPRYKLMTKQTRRKPI